MWGTSSPDHKLTSDLGNGTEATKIAGRRTYRLSAGKLSPGNFRLLQQYLPQPDSCSAAKQLLFDDLVGEREQIVGDFDTERLRGLEVDNEFEFCGVLNRQIRWLGAFENPIDVDSRSPKQIVRLKPVGQ